jgi:hypothetical protein
MLAFAEIFCPFPLSNRYIKLYGFGVNRISTNGSVMIVANSMCNLDNEVHDYDEFQTLNSEQHTKKLLEMTVH